MAPFLSPSSGQNTLVLQKLGGTIMGSSGLRQYFAHCTAIVNEPSHCFVTRLLSGFCYIFIAVVLLVKMYILQTSCLGCHKVPQLNDIRSTSVCAEGIHTCRTSWGPHT
ncbi:hypothetical protein XENTR_v10019379 [Xenopus tropicalis]|nr:hypothetical protein XENTR_v10019379 [Xenopus tropicalis]